VVIPDRTVYKLAHSIVARRTNHELVRNVEYILLLPTKCHVCYMHFGGQSYDYAWLRGEPNFLAPVDGSYDAVYVYKFREYFGSLSETE